jgi:ABC-2 type transport system permease protein
LTLSELEKEGKHNKQTEIETVANTTYQRSGFNKFLKAFNDFRIILIEQVYIIRRYLVYFLFLNAVGPFALVFAMGHYAGFRPDHTELLRIISGTVTFALVTVGFTSIAQRLSVMRQQGTLLYYCALPINKLSFVAALLISRLIILIPSITMPIVGGILMYNLEIHLDFWLLGVMILGSFSLVALGTMLGVLVKSYELISLVCNAFIVVMALASPNFIPSYLLPLPLQLLGWLLPSTYTSDAISHCMAGSYDSTFYFDVLVLLGMAVLGLVLTGKFLKWSAD